MKRSYLSVVKQHLNQYSQMVFLSGPRQVGKTTLSKASVEEFESLYLNWDSLQDRALFLSGMDKIYDKAFGQHIALKPRAIIFDEIHKYRQWKTLLKGYFDTFKDKVHFIITGSAKLNIYRCGGDSMMGRYFSYRIHPFSVAECIKPHDTTSEIQAPQFLSDELWHNLLTFGGFPEPFLNADPQFYQRWQNLRQEQLFQEDLRDIAQVHDMARLELLAYLLKEQVTGVVKYNHLATKVRVSEPTIRKWIDILNSVYYSFSIKPWSKNVARAILKEPKIYLWDWSSIESIGAKIENFVASHLLKAVHWWTDIGLGKYELFYVRDKEGAEVDFLIVKNAKPWMLIEVKTSANQHISAHLQHFYQQLQPEYAFQVVYDLPYQDIDCFKATEPVIVSLRTFLSQLV